MLGSHQLARAEGHRTARTANLDAAFRPVHEPMILIPARGVHPLQHRRTNGETQPTYNRAWLQTSPSSSEKPCGPPHRAACYQGLLLPASRSTGLGELRPGPCHGDYGHPQQRYKRRTHLDAHRAQCRGSSEREIEADLFGRTVEIHFSLEGPMGPALWGRSIQQRSGRSIKHWGRKV